MADLVPASSRDKRGAMVYPKVGDSCKLALTRVYPESRCAGLQTCDRVSGAAAVGRYLAAYHPYRTHLYNGRNKDIVKSQVNKTGKYQQTFLHGNHGVSEK